MDEPRIVWDPHKATSNLAKHGITFLAARTALRDPGLRTWSDPRHDPPGLRDIVIGIDEHGRLLVVVTDSAADGSIRLISARRATMREAHAYRTGHL